MAIAKHPIRQIKTKDKQAEKFIMAASTPTPDAETDGRFIQPPIRFPKELLERIDVPIHVQGDEVEWVTRVTGVGEDSLVAHDPGDVVAVGDFEVALIHTPGHTPGSQCLLVNGRLISGDTLFLDGCGRTDLPGADPNEMYRTLTQRLSNIADDTVLFPGHLYSADPSAPMDDVRRHNRALVPASAEQWLAMFAG